VGLEAPATQRLAEASTDGHAMPWPAGAVGARPSSKRTLAVKLTEQGKV